MKDQDQDKTYGIMTRSKTKANDSLIPNKCKVEEAVFQSIEDILFYHGINVLAEDYDPLLFKDMNKNAKKIVVALDSKL